MSDLWSGFTASFMENMLNVCVYIAILALFALAFIKCVLPVWHTRSLLKRAIRSIKAGEKSRRSWQDDKFLGRGVLYPHWSEYLDNLFFADGEYHNASNVEDYINEETVIRSPGRAGLAQAAPGLMVSLGFLGTLLGITQGLSGFSMENSEAVMTAIRTLVPGMKYAFTTSVVGVVCSILFTVFTGIVNGAAQNTLSDFYAAMHNNAGVLTVDPLNQIAIYQQEQTAQVRAIANTVGSELTESISAALHNAMQPIAESLNAFCAHTTQEQTRALDNVVTAFVHRMNDALSGQLSAFAANIDTCARMQKHTLEEIDRITVGMNASVRDLENVERLSRDMISGFTNYLARLENAQKLADAASERAADTLSHMEVVARQQTVAMQSASAAQTEMARSIAGMRTAIEEQVHTLNDLFTGARTGLESAAASLKNSADTLTESHKAFVTGVNEDLEKTYNAFFKDIGDTTSRLEWMVEDVKATMERLPAILEQFSAAYEDQCARIEDMLHGN